ncbi:MAG: CrcB family protein [Pontimonas sp.]
MRFREGLAVAIGGAVGTLARVGALEATGHLPWGELLATLVVNALGAFGLAFVASRGLPEFPPWVYQGVTVGFLGSYTTFSAIALITTSEWGVIGIGYLVLTLAIGVVMVLAGRWLGRASWKEAIT